MLDGMTGSGTFAIEAALIANKIPPGYYRKEFGFMRWKDFNEELYNTIYESIISKIGEEQPKIEALGISCPYGKDREEECRERQSR